MPGKSWSKGHGGKPNALNNAQIRELRETYARAYNEAAARAARQGGKVVVRGAASQKELAKRYGVTQPYVSKVVRGDIHRDAGGPITRNW